MNLQITVKFDIIGATSDLDFKNNFFEDPLALAEYILEQDGLWISDATVDDYEVLEAKEVDDVLE